jgi:hypothetical protein
MFYLFLFSDIAKLYYSWVLERQVTSLEMTLNTTTYEPPDTVTNIPAFLFCAGFCSASLYWYWRWRSNNKKWTGMPFTDLTQPHICACFKHKTGFYGF